RGVQVDAVSREKLFQRFRQLRIYRQWDLAETYFKRLLERESTPGGHSAFEHRIQMQLAVNAFEPKHNEKALDYLQGLREAYRAGHTSGIRIHIVDKYLARTLARMGRFNEALAALKRRLDRYGRQSRRRKLIEFFREHGRYEKAYQLADSAYSSWRKRRWPYGWLLYKTGRFKRAAEHFEQYGRARDDRPRAKGLYWAARAHERAGRPEKARALFEEVAKEFARGYYGIQAVNRLRDLRQRNAVDGVFAEQTGSVLESSNKVFAAFDDASEAMAQRPGTPRIDTSMVPRVPSDSEGTPVQSLEADHCLANPGQTLELCRMMSGDIPEATAAAIERTIAPFQIQPKTPAADTSGRAPTVAAPAGSGDSAKAVAGRGVPRAGRPNRISYPTQARIYWEGRHDSQVAFAKFADGQAIGPIPEPRAYGKSDPTGGIDRAVERAGDLFPDLIRTDWLYDAGLVKPARTVARGVALEFRGISRRPMPPDGRPHELPYKRWSYLVDYRQYGHKGMWGYDGEDVPRFPVPDGAEARRKLADRQQTIRKKRDKLRPALVSALKEVGDYHLVRKFTLEKGDWIHHPPSPSTRDEWMQAYPRAFPRKVLAESREHGINPYLIWSLMTVESAYNPDSISPAQAIGLLQVIPRTGIKVATWLGDDDFGPHDLIDEEVAIEQGVSYFGSLVRKFRGQELLAVAGYNGGPHRVAAWMDKRGTMPLDEFVEEVPFTQARNYVKKVTRYLGLYLRLYEGRKRLYIGQTIDGDYKHYPNF
ncbi:MAG: transglycosylase SLT domain-containing protein, partial [Bradymonadaceae bacterium]